MPTHVFVGPTLPAQDVLTAVPEAHLHSPIAHGDLFGLDPGPGDIVIIIDGYFHQVASIRHKEILWALAQGARVVGCSSLGALRAAEMFPYGMIGHGVVYQMYRDGVIDADDEVTLPHGDPPEYRKFAMPLVNLRHAVAMAQRDGALSAEEGAHLVAVCRRLHYAARSWRAIEKALTDDGAEYAGLAGRVRGHLVRHPEHADVKAADALDTLSHLDDLCARHRPPDPEWTGSPLWRNRLVHEWQAEFSGTWTDGIHVSAGAVMQYQQIYRHDFPQRWSAFALRGIRDAATPRPAGPPGGDLDADALAASAAHGVDGSRLTPGQRAEWLTPREIAGLPADAAVMRTLVRSYRPQRGIFDLIAAEPALVADQTARTAVAESSVVNSEVATWGPQRDVAYLRRETLQGHLAETWECQDERSLTAAARDRGFASLTEAVEAVRPFYLRHHLETDVPVSADGSRS